MPMVSAVEESSTNTAVLQVKAVEGDGEKGMSE